MNDPLPCATCPVRDRAACAALSDHERNELGHLGHHRTLQRGEILFASGDRSSICATLISGALKISSFGEDGIERILSLIHPAGFVGELFAPMARHDVIALTESRLCVFSTKDYVRAIERFPALGRALLRRSSEDLFESRSLIDLTTRRNARQKVAGFLVSMAHAASASPCRTTNVFELPLTRGEIGGMLGLTIETVSRQMTQLETDGLIERWGPRGVLLKDSSRLTALAA